MTHADDDHVDHVDVERLDGNAFVVTDPKYWAKHPPELLEVLSSATDVDAVAAVREQLRTRDIIRWVSLPFETAGRLLLTIFSVKTLLIPGSDRLTMTVEEAAARLGISRSFGIRGDSAK